MTGTEPTIFYKSSSLNSAIFIKEALGFRRFSLRGLAKVRLEWTLVTLAYNLKRLVHPAGAVFHLKTGAKAKKSPVNRRRTAPVAGSRPIFA